MWTVLLDGDASNPLSTLIRRMRSACCARPARGHDDVPPSPSMNSRRRIDDTLKLLCGQPITAYRGRASMGTANTEDCGDRGGLIW
jgi:hypothetical protein